MFAFKRPKVVNQLTQLINKDPNGTKVKDVLSNNDLSPSIRNEVPELLDFFCPPQASPPNIEKPENMRESNKLQEDRQTELSLLAFTSKLNREGEEYAEDKYFRFNRNASNIISSPSKKFHDRLVYYYSDGNGKYTPSPFLEQLIKFARSMRPENNVHHQAVFYGHFHRIFEALVRSSKGQFFDAIYKLAPDLNPFYTILLNRIDLTSIRQLYITCTSEFPQQFAGSDCKNQDPSVVFIELSKFGANESLLIRGKRGKTLRKVHVKKDKVKEFNSEKSKNKDFNIVQSDDVGYKKRILNYMSKEDAAKQTNAKKITRDSQSISGKTKMKKSRYYHFQLVISSLIAIRDIMNDSTEVVRYFRNNEVIENLLKIGKNAPESSFIVSLSYNLILRIATSDRKNLNEFKNILNQKEFLPDMSKLPDLKRRIETIQTDSQCECSGEHLIYQMPLYFLDLSEDFHNLFFTEKKYSDKFDEQFVYSIKHVLSKQEQIDYFTRNDNKFLRNLCKVLPEPPKLDLANYSNNDTSVDPELPPIQVHDNKVEDDFLPKSREPLQSFLWDVAKYIDDEKRFKEDEIKFKSSDEWTQLHDKVTKYYERVYAFVSEPVDEEEEDMQD